MHVRPCAAARFAGLTGGDRLALYVHSPDTIKQLLLPPSFLRRFQDIQIRTDLVDMQVGGSYPVLPCWGLAGTARQGLAGRQGMAPWCGLLASGKGAALPLALPPPLAPPPSSRLPKTSAPASRCCHPVPPRLTPSCSPALTRGTACPAGPEQVYVFHTPTLKAVLAANEKLKHLEEQLVPHMIRYQLKPRRSVGEEEAAALAASYPAAAAGGGGGLAALEGSMADLSLSGLSGSSAAGGGGGGGGTPEWYCCAYLAPEGSFCQRANTLQGYADVNRCGCGRVCRGVLGLLPRWQQASAPRHHRHCPTHTHTQKRQKRKHARTRRLAAHTVLEARATTPPPRRHLAAASLPRPPQGRDHAAECGTCVA